MAVNCRHEDEGGAGSTDGFEKVIGVQDDRAGERPVRAGRRAGDRVEIVEGLAAGDPVEVGERTWTGGGGPRAGDMP